MQVWDRSWRYLHPPVRRSCVVQRSLADRALGSRGERRERRGHARTEPLALPRLGPVRQAAAEQAHRWAPLRTHDHEATSPACQTSGGVGVEAAPGVCAVQVPCLVIVRR